MDGLGERDFSDIIGFDFHALDAKKRQSYLLMGLVSPKNCCIVRRLCIWELFLVEHLKGGFRKSMSNTGIVFLEHALR